MGYYYMTQAYQPGQVLNWLPAGDYTKILGLDMGSGTTRAYLYQYDKEDQGWQKRTLVLNRSQDGNSQVTIPTCISYREDRVCIGYDVDLGRATQNFKYPPTQWEMIKPDGVHTSREMQHDFTAQLLRQIKDNNGDILLGGKLLVAVGCPTSPDWMEADAYEELIREAIGHVHVTVVPEGWAAIWSVIGNLEATKGIAVYDLGASSVKFSYVLPGKCFRSRSRELGGNQIDEEIFDQVFADDDLSIENEKVIMPQIREIKEAYYPHKRPAGGELKDREGQVIRSLRLNDTVMHQVLGIREDGSPVRGAWYDRLRQFLEETKVWIGDLPCGYVVLIGGTSWIPEVLELAEKVFALEDRTIKRTENFWMTVAGGLCDAKRWEILVVQWYEEKYGSLVEGIKACGTQWYPNFVNSFAGKIAAKSRDVVRQIARPYWEANQSVHVDVFAEKSKAALQKAFTHEALVRTHAEVLGSLERPDEKEPDFISYAEFARPEDPVEQTYTKYYSHLRERLRAAVMNYVWWISASKDWDAWMDDILKRHLSGLDTAEVRSELARLYPADIEAQKIVEGYLSKGLKPGLTSGRLFWAPTKGAVRKAREKLKDTLTPEALEEGWKAFVAHSAKGLEKSDVFQKQFAELNQSLFEIALGQTLMLVFEEKADVQ